MKTYIGTKIVNMEPMTRAQYNIFRGWELPADEDGADEGYLVEYLDGGKPNVPTHSGYVSWSPKVQADAAYRETSGMPFGLAIEALKKGKRVARTGWNGNGMWLVLVPARLLSEEVWEMFTVTECIDINDLAWIGMKTSDNGFVPWVASQPDMLADDWQII